eukprot:Hpha_TRINITY_DN16889_c5_g1::TRINITY_DN16889_c5_g1_i2::g.148309::m.148309
MVKKNREIRRVVLRYRTDLAVFGILEEGVCGPGSCLMANSRHPVVCACVTEQNGKAPTQGIENRCRVGGVNTACNKDVKDIRGGLGVLLQIAVTKTKGVCVYLGGNAPAKQYL